MSCALIYELMVYVLYFLSRSELSSLETGLLIEVWDKGMLWDKVIGYYWAPLRLLQATPTELGGKWLPLDMEVVMENGQILATRSPTGHTLFLDYRFELPNNPSECYLQLHFPA